MPNEEPVGFILRCIELREKLILTFKTNGEIEYDEVLVSSLFLRFRDLKNNLILQEIRPVLRSQGVTDEDILSATQRTAVDKEDRARKLSKKPSKVNRVVGNPAGSEFDCSDLEKSKFGQKNSKKVIPELTETLPAVTEQLAAFRKDVYLLKTQGYNPASYVSIEQNMRQCKHCFKCGASRHRGKDCKSSKFH